MLERRFVGYGKASGVVKDGKHSMSSPHFFSIHFVALWGGVIVAGSECCWRLCIVG